jgi:hypothetical protein
MRLRDRSAVRSRAVPCMYNNQKCGISRFSTLDMPPVFFFQGVPDAMCSFSPIKQIYRCWLRVSRRWQPHKAQQKQSHKSRPKRGETDRVKSYKPTKQKA